MRYEWQHERKQSMIKKGEEKFVVVFALLLFDESGKLIWDATLINVYTNRKKT